MVQNISLSAALEKTLTLKDNFIFWETDQSLFLEVVMTHSPEGPMKCFLGGGPMMQSHFLEATTMSFLFPVQLFEEELAPVGEAMRRADEQAQQLNVWRVQLSPENTQALQQLSNQWRLLQVTSHPPPTHSSFRKPKVQAAVFDHSTCTPLKIC